MAVKHRKLVGASILAGTIALAVAVPAISQGGASSPARYTIDAGTISGMAAMGAGGGGIGSALSVLGGGGGQTAHELRLRLGSGQTPAGEPRGDHFMPQGARLGTSVPLITPRQNASLARDGSGSGDSAMSQTPSGRLLLFWGCGEHAPAGQPVVIDFSKLAKGEVPQGLYAQSLDVPEAWQVSLSNSTTFGEWPNAEDSKRVPANSSLVGKHRIASTYAPEISFDLAEDFMPALRPSTADVESGAVNLSWNSLPTATGYYAWVMAMNPDEGGQARDMVWWTSSSSQQFGGPMSDWLSPGTVKRLVDNKTVLPASQTNCTIPAEVREQGGPMMMVNLFAYGPEADFSYPARPANAARNWQPDWIARARFRANSMVMHGMPGLGGASAAESRAEPARQQSQQLPKCRGLSGIAKRAAGLCE